MTVGIELKTRNTDLTPSQVAEWISYHGGFICRGYALAVLQFVELSNRKTVRWTWLVLDNGTPVRTDQERAQDRTLDDVTGTVNFGGWKRADAHITYNEANP